jgi:hypothetical protein
MNDDELFETELKRLKPARPPEELMGRLAASVLERTTLVETRSSISSERTPAKAGIPNSFGWLRWLVPGTALAGAACLVALVLSRDATRAGKPRGDSVENPALAHLKADDVQIDRRLVASFDAVARLPDGAPLRVRCREWADKVVVVDSGNGVVIEQTQPRLEVVPVNFEIY